MASTSHKNQHLRLTRAFASLAILLACACSAPISSALGASGEFKVERELQDESVKYEVPRGVWRASFTVATRVRLYEPGGERGNGDGLGMVFNVSNGWYDGFRLYYNWRESRFCFQIGRPTGGAYSARASEASLAGIMRDVVVVYDSFARYATLYVDGVKQGECSCPEGATLKDETLNVGFGGAGVGSNRMYVDRVEYWDRALTAAEVASRNASRPASELAQTALFANLDLSRSAIPVGLDYRNLEAAQTLELSATARALIFRAYLFELVERLNEVTLADLPSYDELLRAVLNAATTTEPESTPPTVDDFERYGALKTALESLAARARELIIETRKPDAIRANRAQARETAERLTAYEREVTDALKALGARFPNSSSAFVKLGRYDSVVGYARRLERDALSVYTGLLGEPTSDRYARHLYVSPQGSDESGDGSSSSPFGTLSRAFEEVERLSSAGEKKRFVVELAPGEYRATRTAKLTGVSNVVVESSSGVAVLTGGRRIVNFAPFGSSSSSDAEHSALYSRVRPEIQSRLFVSNLALAGITEVGRLANRGYGMTNAVKPIPSLYCNGVAQTLARWPNADEPRVSFGEKVELATAPSKSSSFKYDFDRVDAWRLTGDAEKDDVWAFGLFQWEWAANFRRVLNLDRENKTVTFDYENGSGKFDYYFVNVLEELDAPGEYYVDRESGLLFFYPPAEFADLATLNSGAVEYDEFDGRFIELENTTAVLIRNLALKCGRETAITMKNCQRCFFDHGVIEQMGGHAAVIEGGAFCGVLNSRLRSLGACGVRMSGGDRENLTPCRHILSNCYVSDFSRIDRVYAPALHATGCGIVATNNLICNSPHHAFRTDGNDIYIARNEVHSVAYEYSDQAGIDVYCDPTYRGIVIERNLWRHIGSSFALCGQAGIRLDDSISGVVMQENVFYRASGGNFGGIQIHGGKDNLAQHNLFVDCKQAFSFSPWRNDRYLEFIRDRFPAYVESPLYRQRYPFFDELEEHIDRNFIIANGAVNCGRFDVNGAGLDVFVGNWRRDVAPDLRALGVTDPVELAQDPREAFLYDSKALRRWLEELAGFSLKDVGLKADWQDANEPVSPHYSEGTR